MPLPVLERSGNQSVGLGRAERAGRVNTTLVAHKPLLSTLPLSPWLTLSHPPSPSRRRYRVGLSREEVERPRGCDARHESMSTGRGRTHTCSTRKTGATRRLPLLRGWLRRSSPTDWLTAHVATRLRVLLHVRSSISLHNHVHHPSRQRDSSSSSSSRWNICPRGCLCPCLPW